MRVSDLIAGVKDISRVSVTKWESRAAYHFEDTLIGEDD